MKKEDKEDYKKNDGGNEKEVEKYRKEASVIVSVSDISDDGLEDSRVALRENHKKCIGG